MEYVEILWTALYWYAIAGAVLLVGSVIVYGLALLLYQVLVWLGTAIRCLPGYGRDHLRFSLKGHHPAGNR
jgi:hypothetical protein